MITYELAKKLKDAGFPQDWREGMSFFYRDGDFQKWGCEDHGHDSDAKHGTKVPSLSELIESVKDKENGFCLHQDDDGSWTCTNDYEIIDFGMQGDWYDGSTPEEAVARLWLAISEKKQ